MDLKGLIQVLGNGTLYMSALHLRSVGLLARAKIR